MLCSVCQLPIAEAVHPTGLHPSGRECPFCHVVFSRVDAAQRHARRCPQRGARVLHAKKRGRKTLSCDRCSQIKIHCNARVQTPCDGCAARQLTCVFSRCCTNAAHRQLVNAALPDSPPSNKGRVALSFLLNATDNKQDFITEKAVGKEPDGALLGPICVTPPQAQFESEQGVEYIDPMLLLPSSYQPDLVPLQLGSLSKAGEEDLLGTLLSSRSHGDRLAARIHLLESHVGAFTRSHDRYRNSFDAAAFRRFFSASNVYTFAATFCRKRHYQYPIIHWPTFVLEEASLPLLMVICLTGATYSYHPGHEPEHVTNARKLYPLADAYVFDQARTYLDRPSPDIGLTEAIQLCQASLLMYGLDTLLAGDAAMQHTAVTQRLPALVSSLRMLGFMHYQHDTSEDWQLFVHREHIIRLVSWTFCADCLATLSCNNPPLFSMLEMMGDLPCEPELWDADSELDFVLLKSAQPQPSHCLKDLMASFLHDERRIGINLERLPLFHLHIVMCGLQHIIFNLHVTMMLPQQSDKLLRMLTVWRDLWGRAIERIPASHRDWLGVARQVPGIGCLSRRVIEVAVGSEAASSRYLQRIPSYGTRELHEFIRDYVVKA